MNIRLTEAFEAYWNGMIALMPKLVFGCIIILLFYVIGRLFFRFIGRRIERRWHDSILSSFLSESIKYAIYLTGIIIALHVIGFGGIASGIIAGAGVSAIVFGFAFKDIGENFLAGFLLAFNSPFELGDIIEVEGFKGTVKNLDLRTTQIRSAEGKDIFIPNSMIMKNSLINFTKDGNLRINFIVGIAPETDVEVCRRLILDYLLTHQRVLKTPQPNVIVQELAEFTVDLNVLFWIDLLANQQNADEELGHTVRSQVIADVKLILDKNGIQMPSQVIEHKMYRDNVIHTSSDANN